MRVIDLFSGIGGFSLGLQMAGGFETVQFVEIDPWCRAVLAKNFPGVPIHDDIRTFRPVRGSADVVVGGFPCQDISNAGKRAGIEGERSGLWSELARVICEVRPRFAIVENVAALLGRGLGRVLGDLAEIGYDAEWHCIPASAVGALHHRDRVWIVAYPHADGVRPQGIRLSQAGPWSNEQFARLVQAEISVSLPAGRRSGISDGVSGRVDRLKSLGNAVVPQVVAEIGKALRAA